MFQPEKMTEGGGLRHYAEVTTLVGISPLDLCVDYSLIIGWLPFLFSGLNLSADQLHQNVKIDLARGYHCHM